MTRFVLILIMSANLMTLDAYAQYLRVPTSGPVQNPFTSQAAPPRLPSQLPVRQPIHAPVHSQAHFNQYSNASRVPSVTAPGRLPYSSQKQVIQRTERSTPWNTFAYSIKRRPLEVAHFGTGKNVVLVLGPLEGTHTSALAVTDKLAEFFQHQYKQLPADVSLVIMREVNPDGRYRRRDSNEGRVMINRNFPSKNWIQAKVGRYFVSGLTPDSEPETSAVLKLLNTHKPNMVISLRSESSVGSIGVLGSSKVQLLSDFYEESTKLGVVSIPEPSPTGSLEAYLSEDFSSDIAVIQVSSSNSANENWNILRETFLFALGEIAMADAGASTSEASFRSSIPNASPAASKMDPKEEADLNRYLEELKGRVTSNQKSTKLVNTRNATRSPVHYSGSVHKSNDATKPARQPWNSNTKEKIASTVDTREGFVRPSSNNPIRWNSDQVPEKARWAQLGGPKSQRMAQVPLVGLQATRLAQVEKNAEESQKSKIEPNRTVNQAKKPLVALDFSQFDESMPEITKKTNTVWSSVSTDSSEPDIDLILLPPANHVSQRLPLPEENGEEVNVSQSTQSNTSSAIGPISYPRTDR